MPNRESASRTNTNIDIAKYVLAFLVVAIHSELFPTVLYPWLRIAVPMFFIISAYLFFSKLKNIADAKSQRKALRSYLLRILRLYAFWFVVFFPVVVFRMYGFYTKSFWWGIYNTFRCLLFGSTFPVSWYLSASIVGTLIVFALRRVPNALIIFFGAAVYVCVCLTSTYKPFVVFPEPLSSVIRQYEKFMGGGSNSFPAALVWIAAGKWFAENKFERVPYLAIAISAVLLYAEWRVVRSFGGKIDSDCFVFLIPLCINLFPILLIAPSKKLDTKPLRSLSTVIYTSHGAIIGGIRMGMQYLFAKPICDILTFVLTVLSSVLIYFLIIHLEKKPRFRFMRYAH